MKILDCTLRDGGYYTNWDFDKKTVDRYISAMNKLPVDYIEIGYRNKLSSKYAGKYFYMPLYELKDIRQKTDKKLVIILMEDDVEIADLDALLGPIKGLADMIRIAFSPSKITYAIELAKAVKSYGFEVGFNVMYMSEWLDNTDFMKNLDQVNEVADVFYMVDSYGGVFPEDMVTIIQKVKEKVTCPLGFHGHDNLHMALANAFTAIKHGVEYIDATIMGMGRGAGNLQMELLLTALNKKIDLEVDFYELERAVSAIMPLWKKHLWGTNLPYMISGSNSFSQGAVMDWETSPFYTFNSIIRTLNNKKDEAADYKQYKTCEFKPSDEVLIVGSDISVSNDIDGILHFLKQHPNLTIIHSSSTNVQYLTNLSHRRYFCLVGNAGKRLERHSNYDGPCILPPNPEETGTYVPQKLADKTYKLSDISYDEKFNDRQTALALQMAENLKAKHVFLIGHDGISNKTQTKRDFAIVDQNELLFSTAAKKFKTFESLTETNYTSLPNNANLFYYLTQE